jgi:hypothetical protein
MPYDDQGNYVEDNPAQDFAVQTGGAPAPTSNFLTEKDFTYTAPVATTEPQEGSYDNEGNYVPPYNDPYKGGFLSYDGQNFAAPSLHEAGGGFDTPYYEARTNTGDLAAAVMAGEGQGIRLLDSSGNVIYQGTGPNAARDATAIANKLSMEGGKTAAWNIQIEDPANKGTFNSAGYESVDKVKDHTLRNLLVDVIPQIVAAVATGGTSLGLQMAAAAAATIPGSVVQHKSLTDSIFRAALAGGTAGVLKGTNAGQAFTSGVSKGVTGATNAITGATVPAAVNAAAPAVAGELPGVLVTASKSVVPAAVRGTLSGLPNLVGGSGKNFGTGDGAGDTLPGANTVDGVTVEGSRVPTDVDPVVVDMVRNRMARGATLDQAMKALGVTLTAAELTALTQPVLNPADIRDIPKDVGTPNNPLTLPPVLPLSPLDKAKALFDTLTPLQKASLGLKVASAGTLAVGALSGGSGGGSGAPGTVKTIDQQRAGLPDIFRAQLGAPRGLFSALGTAGTPYTPRPVSNIIPDPVVNTNGSGGANPSGTAALSDYLRRYPDVAAEAKANPGAYDDVNEDGVIDDNDFALMHYLLHGKDEGRTLAVKTGGYIQHPSRDTDMHNPRFQVMRKAKGGDVDRQLPAQVLPAEPDTISQLAQSFAVDPRALAESYRSGTVAPPSVMQPRQSPYSGYDPGTMGGMYHYGEGPTGETQHFNYALAPGSVAPWMASTPTGTGVYNMFGVKTGGAGAGAGGAGTGTTPGTTTTGTTTTAPTPISDADRAQYSAYVNAYPDLAKAFKENNAAYGDFNNDGKVDIADFGLGQYTNYGKAEGRALTGPAATVGAPADTIIGGANTGATDADAQKLMSSLGVFNDPTGFHYQDADYAKMLLDQYRSGALDPGSGTVQQLKDAGFKAGGSPPRNQFAVRGPGTGRSDSIPAALSDGEYVMDAETVALLGDGSSKAGAKKLDAMRGNLRKHKGRSLAKGRFSVNAKAPEAYLSGGRT